MINVCSVGYLNRCRFKKLLGVIILLSGFSGAASVQKNLDHLHYNDGKIRLLIKTSARYLYVSSQGTIDQDSAMVIVCKTLGVSYQLSYDEDFYDPAYKKGSDLISAGNIRAAGLLLSRLEGSDRVSLLLQLGAYYLYKPGSDKSDLDLARHYFFQAKTLSDSLKNRKWQLAASSMIGKFYQQAGDFRQSKVYMENVEKATRFSGDTLSRANALNNLGTCLQLGDKMKFTNLKKAEDLYHRLGEREKECDVQSKIIEIHFRETDFARVEKELLTYIALQKSIGFRHLQYAFSTLAYIKEVTGNLSESVRYATSSVKAMEESGDFMFADAFYTRIGNTYSSLENYPKAIYYYEKALKSKPGYGRNTIWYKAFISQVITLSSLGDQHRALDLIKKMTTRYPPTTDFDRMYVAQITASCYEGLKDFTKATKYHLEACRIADLIKSGEMKADVVYNYAASALFFTRRGNEHLAKIYIQKALNKSKGATRIANDKLIELAEFKVDSLSGNFKNAIVHYQKYKTLNDSIFNINKTRLIEEFQIKYETAKKVQDLQLKEKNISILKSESRLQKGEIQRTGLIAKFIGAGVVLLMIVVGLLYNRYLVKQKTNKQLMQLVNDKESLLTDKEWLLKEIHHRVKNNLQMMSSLMNIQTAYSDSSAAINAIQESQNRMNAMSLLHQKLYQSPTLSRIQMNVYISELIGYLTESFSIRQKIRIQIDVTPIDLDISQALPIGLILNEAVTNSIKYAFPGLARGEINVSLTAEENDWIILKIADNGVGLPPGYNFQKSATMGMELIQTFTEQLGGTCSIDYNSGLSISIIFRNEFVIDHGLSPVKNF